MLVIGNIDMGKVNALLNQTIFYGLLKTVLGRYIVYANCKEIKIIGIRVNFGISQYQILWKDTKKNIILFH